MSKSSPSDRKSAPVFVMGCHRSGTNLLYDMLLSSGGFAIYRGFLPIYKILIPRFGSMENAGNRAKILETWLRSKGFRRTGLDAEKLSARIMNECRNGGDFIRVVMDSVAESQQMPRWAVYDPDNVLHVERVKRDIPNALFVHIIRDGRDIALSLKKMGGFSPLPWDRGQTDSLVATALYWEWMIHQGRAHGSKFPADYVEIRYEDLITSPHETLGKLGRFLDHDLNYDRIQSAGLGRLSETNSSFREEGAKEKLNPLGRWKERLAHQDVAAIEATVGNCLEENGYELSLPPAERQSSLRHTAMRGVYPAFLGGKLWMKLHTPVGRMASMAALELQDEPAPVAESVRL
ncbi:MAG TPA: sulfotransferase [Terriglobales bacterium]|nr:sulfotransferase [Terriglobales bacterium]